MADRYEIGGEVVTMPVEVRDASAGTAMFEVDLGAAAALVPDAFEPVPAGDGTTQLAIAVIDYRDNDLGQYHEVGITFFVRPTGGPTDGSADGTYIWRLPVDQEFTCLAGRQIWGFPKTVEEIGWVVPNGTVVVTLGMDGEPVFRLTLPRGGADHMPQVPMTTYTVLDGAPSATEFSQGGSGSQVLVGGDDVVLELGEHPVAKELASLGLPGPAVMSTWTEHMHGTFGEPRPL